MSALTPADWEATTSAARQLALSTSILVAKWPLADAAALSPLIATVLQLQHALRARRVSRWSDQEGRIAL